MPDSNITKHAIAAALKELCREKSFDKISIADITSTCGLNRQTFYYHFEDKYELLNWIYYTEGFARLVDGITLENWDSHIAVLFETMRADKSSTKIRCAVRRTPLETICSKWCAHFSWRPSKLWTMARYRMLTRRFLQTFMPTEAAEQSELGCLPV